MAERIVRLNGNRNFFSGGGLYLINRVNPTHTYSDADIIPISIINSIKSGVLIDVNDNILNTPVIKEEVIEEEILEEASEEGLENAEEESSEEVNNNQRKQGNRKYRKNK